MNSEATLNCNGKDFKCVNSTHYQSCSLTQRNGQQAQWMINGVVLPCLAGQTCSEQDTVCCSVVRTVKLADELTQIPVEVTVVQEFVSKPAEKVPSKSLPEVKAPVIAPVAVKSDVVPTVSSSENSVVPSAGKGKILNSFTFIKLFYS